MTIEKMYDYLMDNLGVSEQTMNVVCCINGYSKETMEDILYAVTGYKYFDQYIEEINKED